MKNIFLYLIAIVTLLISCDDNTEGLGASIVNPSDRLDVTTCTYGVTSESVVADSVVSRSITGYLGKVKDPATGTYLTSSIMTELHTLDPRVELFPTPEDIAKRNGVLKVDSCSFVISYKSYYGDPLALMKCKIHELDHPVEDNNTYYSSFSPMNNGYIREGGIHKELVYTLSDQSTKVDQTQYVPSIKIHLNEPYTAKDGRHYDNYGWYIVKKYYENKKDFATQYDFQHNVCPGFYIESVGGVGSMAYVYVTQLNVRCTYVFDTDSIDKNGAVVRDSAVNVVNFCGTEEVLQLSDTQQDPAQIKALAEETGHTYLKTPAGIFTRITLPVDSIMRDFDYPNEYKLRNDTINSASMVIKVYNNNNDSQYNLPIPATLLLVPDTMKEEFFTKNMVSDGYRSTLISYSSSDHGYKLGNVTNILTTLAKDKYKYLQEHKDMTSEQYDDKFPNWNKMLLIPVNANYATVGGSSILTRVVNDMSLGSAMLEGGPDNPDALKINVIYSKFKAK